MNTPILETDRLILRPFKEDDAKDVFECWESDPDVAKYMFWTSHNDLEKTKEWILFELEQIQSSEWYRFAIVLKQTKELIGTALIYYETEVEGWEIAYNLGKKYWGLGYATEAMKKVLIFARKQLELSEIVGRYAKENPASANVMNKLGFKYEKDIPYECNNGTIQREGIQCRLVFEATKIELRNIDDTNIENVIRLEVADDQKQYISSNQVSLQDALDNKEVARPFAIYADGKLVGFTMFAFDLEFEDPNDRYWLWRFMIDKNLQGKGYGSAALKMIIEYFRNYGAGYIKLSTKETNKVALSLYRKFGFKENGEMNGEEMVLQLDL